MRQSGRRLANMSLQSVVCMLFLLLPSATFHQRRGPESSAVHLSGEENEALRLLRTIKRRVTNQLQLQEQASEQHQPHLYSYTANMENNNNNNNNNVRTNYKSRNSRQLHAVAAVKRRQQYCRRWNDPCVPWSSDSEETCCFQRRLVCGCNLWMQNCRCVSRAWGK